MSRERSSKPGYATYAYRHWEVHRIRTTATTVELDDATRVDQIGCYITGLIVVRWPPARGGDRS
ncbi:hypothetical protein ACPXBU_25740 [Micromonospora sp. DT231]